MPQLPGSGITCTPSSSQSGETGCRAPALQQAAPPPAPESLRPKPQPSLCWGWGGSQGSACSKDRHLAPPKPTPPPHEDPAMCSRRGKVHKPSQETTSTRGLSNSWRLQCRRGQGGTGSPSVGSAPRPGSTAGPPACLETAWPWPRVLLGSSKPFTMAGLANTPMPPTNNGLAWHVWCEEGDPSTSWRWKKPAFGSGVELSRGANAFAGFPGAWGHLRRTAGQGQGEKAGGSSQRTGTTPWPPARGGHAAGSRAGQETQPPPPPPPRVKMDWKEDKKRKREKSQEKHSAQGKTP